MRNAIGNRAILVVAIILVTIAGVALVALSPFALRYLASLHEFNWPQLSNIGQTYGAVSAMLVVVGLSGVAITVFLQIRDSRHARIQAARARHYDITRLALDDPVLMQVSGGLCSLQTFDERRQTILINLMLQFWSMLWEFNDMGEAELRAYVADLFATTPGRRYWEKLSVGRIQSAGSRKLIRFEQIIDEEYWKANSIAHQHESANDRAVSRRQRKRGSMLIGIGLGLAFGTTLGSAIVRTLGRRSSS
jgi:Family of unknown function (DUF6082)